MLLATACGGAGEGTPPVGAGSAIALELELLGGDGRAAQRFARGEPVRMVLVVRNTSDAARTLRCASARTHDFHVAAPDGRELWRWSRGRMFAQVLTGLELAPGETLRFEATWDGTGSDGAPLAPGRYEAVGHVTALDPGPLSTRASFTLVD